MRFPLAIGQGTRGNAMLTRVIAWLRALMRRSEKQRPVMATRRDLAALRAAQHVRRIKARQGRRQRQ